MYVYSILDLVRTVLDYSVCHRACTAKSSGWARAPLPTARYAPAHTLSAALHRLARFVLQPVNTRVQVPSATSVRWNWPSGQLVEFSAWQEATTPVYNV